jgi:hypothetical protein
MKEGGIIAGLAFTVAPAYFVGRKSNNKRGRIKSGDTKRFKGEHGADQ